MQKLVLLGLAGVAGTFGRYWLSGVVARRFGETFPWGTLAVNVAGCFLAGLLFYLIQERFPASDTWRAVVFTGFLGAFTTFSAYGLQTFTLMQEGRFGLAALNVAASNVAGLCMVWCGYSLARVLSGAR
ncbi:MAG TPA: fluoride efflux transporter CrcB [Pyrinomonadaceae bacterium]|jgi:CrcB protein|nr:fluoride efflux transporter CrcB [Pyrinomonadaceae bacterium]